MKLILILCLFFMSSTSASSNSNMLPACPDKPNCVSSLANDEHAIAPFALVNNLVLDKQALVTIIRGMGSNVNVIQSSHHIHAEFTSRVFGFVDDIDLVINTKQDIIHIRSASRTGYYDLGVNRRRIEALRSLLKDRGIIQ